MTIQKKTVVQQNKSIASSCFDFIKKHPAYAIISVFVIVLAYGFYATKYTFNFDQLVPEYYDGIVLITAGRWSAPLIHFFTNWMRFSPFWHTVMMMALFWLSGLCWINLFKKASNEKIKDTSLLTFWCLFPIYPMIVEQLTFPILNIALAYVLTPISLWILYPILFENRFKIKNLFVSLIFMIVCIDMYESFAPVFLTGLCAILVLRCIFTSDQSTESSFKSIFFVFLKAVSFLAVAILFDLLISKIVCYICSGSFEFWYNSNTSTKWLEYGNLIDALVWFLRDVFAHYVIVGAGDFSILFFDVMLLSSVITAIIFSVKKKSIIPLIVFMCLCLASVSLCFIKGSAPLYRCEQSLPLFVAFVFMLLFQFAANKKALSTLLSIIAIILVLNETQQINNYAVRNYEIFEYGYSRLREIGNELEKYDTSKKPVVFTHNKNACIYPKAFCTPKKTENPLYSAFSKTACNFWDNILSEKFYKNMNDVVWSYAGIEITDCETLIVTKKSKATIYTPFLTGLSYNDYRLADGYKALEQMGYEYIPCTKDEYKEAQTYLVPDDKSVKFEITETDKMIIVQLMSVE